MCVYLFKENQLWQFEDDIFMDYVIYMLGLVHVFHI